MEVHYFHILSSCSGSLPGEPVFLSKEAPMELIGASL
jgi:hypothetical protein